MRFWIAFMVVILVGAQPAHSQKKNVRTNPGSACGDRSSGLPDFYADTLIKTFEPPDWRHGLIKIAVGGATKVDLWTDGKRYKVWTDTLTPQDIWKFLLDLDQRCRLPADPADAAALIKVKWEGADLSAAQFAQIHQSLTDALSQYVSSAQGRYKSLVGIVYLDSTFLSIVYDNDYEHIEVSVWNDPKREQDKPMLDWFDGVRKLAEGSFHRPFWR